MFSSRSLDKPIPHPVLDDSAKMMRIIGKVIEEYFRREFFALLANPVYDKLTLARAAQIGSHMSSKSARSARQLNRSRERTMIMPLKAHDLEQTTITVRISMTIIAYSFTLPFP